MKFTVLYKPSAEDELARIWTSAPDRNDVAVAADEIDRLLKQNPQTLGESRSGEVRVLLVPPLGVHFQVSEPDRHVWVLEVWRSRAPSSED